jgi:hypothetical protein
MLALSLGIKLLEGRMLTLFLGSFVTSWASASCVELLKKHDNGVNVYKGSLTIPGFFMVLDKTSQLQKTTHHMIPFI